MGTVGTEQKNWFIRLVDAAAFIGKAYDRAKDSLFARWLSDLRRRR